MRTSGSAAGGLEYFDYVPGGVFEQDLGAARADDDVVAERRPGIRSRATSASMSSTRKWMRFHPPGPGLRPSGIGRPAELVGPLRSNRRSPRRTSAKAGAMFEST